MRRATGQKVEKQAGNSTPCSSSATIAKASGISPESAHRAKAKVGKERGREVLRGPRARGRPRDRGRPKGASERVRQELLRERGEA